MLGAGLVPASAAVVHADALPFATAAALSFAAWSVLAGVVLALTRPRLARPGPATMALRPEPPAVAHLLAHRCHVTASAASATLLDLAARRFLDVDQVAPDTFLCRLYAHRADRGPTTPYEAKVLELVRAKGLDDVLVAAGGIIPDADVAKLKEAGIAEVFGPGTTIGQVATYFREHARRRA